MRVWLCLEGAVPGGVSTVEQLLRWVRARKAQILSEATGADESSERMAVLDALFTWTTGVEMPDPTRHAPRVPQPPKVVGGLTCHTGGRIAFERELLALVAAGKADSDRGRELGESLLRRGVLKV